MSAVKSFFLLFFMLLAVSNFAVAEQHVDSDGSEDAAAEDMDDSAWGIRNGCVSTHRIRNVTVLESKTAVLTLTGGKKILMRFRNDCRGLKFNGFIYSSRTGQLCSRFDSINVLHSGNTCMIESFEPYVELDDSGPAADDEAADETSEE